MDVTTFYTRKIENVGYVSYDCLQSKYVEAYVKQKFKTR